MKTLKDKEFQATLVLFFFSILSILAILIIWSNTQKKKKSIFQSLTRSLERRQGSKCKRR